jgi:hypothetical protein
MDDSRRFFRITDHRKCQKENEKENRYFFQSAVLLDIPNSINRVGDGFSAVKRELMRRR